jgi:uncharacterized protein YjbI with pentapeptide repeats
MQTDAEGNHAAVPERMRRDQHPPTGERIGEEEQQLPWRTEPEIIPERQEQLVRRLKTATDVKRGIYPFKGIKLSRADVEWLLARYMKNGESTTMRGGEEERLWGLDLRGADLRNVDLHGLPLKSLRGSLTREEKDEATAEQHATATVLLSGADLSEAHLEQAELSGVHLEKASLREAHLEKAHLCFAYLAMASLARAQMKEVDLSEAHLEKADLSEAHLEKACIERAHLEKAYLNKTRLEQATVSNARLEKAYLSEAHLEKTVLAEAHLEESYLSGAYLQGADLSEAHLEGAYLNEARLKESLLYKAHLERAFLYKAQLEGARLSRTPVAQVNLKKALESGEQHIGTSLADAQWGDVNLAVVQWSQMEMLGDEYEAHQATRAGQKKEDETRLAEYEAAVRANRQLAVALRAQGLDEEAARFAYRAQLLQRSVFRRQSKFGAYIFSLCLDLLAGYGYKPGRSLIAYLIVVFSFMGLYLLNTHGITAHLTWDEALVLSVSSFHGRGFLPQGIALGDSFARLAAAEAVLGLLIEISFIATFTQRFFGR